MKTTILSTWVLFTCCMSLSLTHAADWPSWRGPLGSGVSLDSSTYPSKWSEKDIEWKTRLPGYGISGPVVYGNRVFVTANGERQKDRLFVSSLERNTGKIVWTREYWGGGTTSSHPWTGTSAPTPIVDSKHVYALFSTGEVVCHDHEGNLIWLRSIVRDYGQYQIRHGMASSPALYKNLLLVCVDQEEENGPSYLLALDKNTGKTVYNKPHNSTVTSWASPILATVNGKQQLITGGDKLQGYDPETGEKIWEAAPGGSYSSPVVGKGLAILVGKGHRSVAVKLGGKGDVTDTHTVWTAVKGQPRMPSAICAGDYYLTIKDDGILTCFDMTTGKDVWQKRLGGAFTSSPIMADGKIYFISQTGETTIVRPGKTAKILAKTPALGDRVIACPAVSDGQIFIRGDKFLFCIGKAK